MGTTGSKYYEATDRDTDYKSVITTINKYKSPYKYYLIANIVALIIGVFVSIYCLYKKYFNNITYTQISLILISFMLLLQSNRSLNIYLELFPYILEFFLAVNILTSILSLYIGINTKVSNTNTKNSITNTKNNNLK